MEQTKTTFMDVVIAVDFDGTIVEHRYPEIGKEIPFAFTTLKLLQEKGCRLILWTVRSGDLLEEAVTYCRKKGIDFYAVNKSFPEEKAGEYGSRKIDADIYIDDRNIGGLMPWGEIYQVLFPEPNQGKLKFKKKGLLRLLKR